MKRPFQLVHDALPEFSEPEIVEAIAATLKDQKRSASLQQIIDAVGNYCDTKRQENLAAVIAQAQETARTMKPVPITEEWRERAHEARQRQYERYLAQERRRLVEETEATRRSAARLAQSAVPTQQRAATIVARMTTGANRPISLAA